MSSAYLIREKDKIALKVLVGEIKVNELLALDRQFLSDPATASSVPPPAPTCFDRNLQRIRPPC